MEDGRERRWSLSKGKRRSKDSVSFVTDNTTYREEEARYASKLSAFTT